MFSGESSKLNKGFIMISAFPNSSRFCRGHSAAYGLLRKVFAGFLSFISFICAAFAQTYSDYYFIPTSGNNNKLNDVGNYNVGSISGEPAASLPDFNANVFITADSNGYTANSNYANFNARDVVFKVGDSGTGSNGAWFLLTENNTATIRGDFLFSARNAADWVQAESGVKVLSGANFQVSGDFIVENNNIAGANNAGFKFAFKHHSFDHTNGSVFIGGNLLFRAAGRGTNWATERIEMLTKVTNFTVNGYVDLTQPIVNGSKSNLIWDLKCGGDSSAGDVGNIRVGGLRGDGALKLSKQNSTVNLEFSNSEDHAWAGSLGIVDSTSVFNVTMYANNSGAKQTLRFAADSSNLDDSDACRNSAIHVPNSVSVENGILEMNFSGNVGGKLSVNGSSAAFGATGVSPDYEYGSVAFSRIDWGGGAFAFDIFPNVDAGDLITAAKVDGDPDSGIFNVASGASGLEMKFNVSARDLEMFLYENGVESYERAIMAWETSSNIGEYLGDIALAVSDGVEVRLFVRDDSLVASFSAVPEPAAAAAYFAAAALALAAIRRGARKS